jgi:hypothetical protein
VETGMNNDWLDNALKHEDRYLDDAGFTARVIAALPARRKRAWLRPLLIAGTSIAGLLVALFVLPAENALVNGFVQLMRARSFSAVPLLPVVVIALMFWATIAAAYSEN